MPEHFPFTVSVDLAVAAEISTAALMLLLGKGWHGRLGEPLKGTEVSAVPDTHGAFLERK